MEDPRERASSGGTADLEGIDMTESTKIRCANCGVPILPCEESYTRIPDTYSADCDGPSPTRSVHPTDDANRLSALIAAFKTAFDGTPQDMHLRARAKMALDVLPDEVVRELGTAAVTLATLADKRLGGRIHE